ncbi:hypothetical protein BC936DRAFT_147478 [Jimgerdemannia flammicorona]|uniref:Uncharacterized protein n=1 Tax=Jimgerdemannia flammicorona TaxID=994334 RepID=A0A433D587_9FUNG|nr:hypothetical protein BC936DRAFT_147478 [Jimgerdemannia flammicorona]
MPSTLITMPSPRSYDDVSIAGTDVSSILFFGEQALRLRTEISKVRRSIHHHLLSPAPIARFILNINHPARPPSARPPYTVRPSSNVRHSPMAAFGTVFAYPHGGPSRLLHLHTQSSAGRRQLLTKIPPARSLRTRVRQTSRRARWPFPQARVQ